jgi:MYXO-CTERM domain-containing protein
MIYPGYNNNFIDNITFDDFTPAPEPATWTIMLLALAGLGALLSRRSAAAR